MIAPENYKREIAYILFSQKRLIVLVTLLVTAIAFAVAFLSSPIYGASGSILVKSRKVDKDVQTLESADLRQRPVEQEDLHSEISILTSEPVVGRVLEKLRHTGHADWVEGLATTDGKRLAALTGSISASISPSSNVINVEVLSGTPELAETILRHLFDEYIRYRLDVYNPKQVAAFLSNQRDHYRAQLQAKSREIQAYVESSGVTLGDRQIEHNLEVATQLSNQVNDLETRRISLQQLLRRIERELADPELQFFSYLENTGIVSLSSRVQEASLAYQEARRRFQPGRKEIAERRDYLDRLYGTLKREVRNYANEQKSELAGIELAIGELRQRSEQLRRQNVHLKQGQLTLAQLERDFELLRYSYDTFFKRAEEAITSEDPELALISSYVSILTPPAAYPSKLFPKPRVIVPVGVITGLLLGISLSFLVVFFDHTFKRPEELERVMGIPVVFSLEAAGSVPAARGRSAPVAHDLPPRRRWAAAAVALLVILPLGAIGWHWNDGNAAAPSAGAGHMPPEERRQASPATETPVRVAKLESAEEPVRTAGAAPARPQVVKTPVASSAVAADPQPARADEDPVPSAPDATPPSESVAAPRSVTLPQPAAAAADEPAPAAASPAVAALAPAAAAPVLNAGDDPATAAPVAPAAVGGANRHERHSSVTTVELSDDRSRTASGAKIGSNEQPRAPSPRAVLKRLLADAAVIEPVGGEGHYLHLASATYLPSLTDERELLERQGLAPSVVTAVVEGRLYHRLLLGPYADARQAEGNRQALLARVNGGRRAAR